jgi:hypothetical protein
MTLILTGLRIRHHFNADPDPAFTSRRKRIHILIKVLGIFDLWSTFMSLQASILSSQSESLKLLNYYLVWIRIQLFNCCSNADQDPDSKNNADPEPQLWLQKNES